MTWLRADPIDGLLLDVNLDNVARIVGRPAGANAVDAPREDGEWLLEVGYLSGGSDVIFVGTAAEVEHARDALFGAVDERTINLNSAVAARRRPTI